MSLPNYLLDAILEATDGDEVDAERLAREWQRRLPEMEAATDRARAQAAMSPCTCATSAESAADDRRCSRCWGRSA